MAQSTSREQRQIQEQIEALLSRWVDTSLSDARRGDLVRRALQRRRTEIALDVEALARRIRAEVEVDVRRQQRQRESAAEQAAKGREFVRFNLNIRLQHIVLFTSCIALILTGLPIKFHDTSWAAYMFELMGGIQNSSLWHRIGAVGLIVLGSYHLLYLIATGCGRRNFVQLIPTAADARDLAQMIRYFIGRTRERPKFGRFSYVEKFDYWAVYWGVVIMVGSGCLLWFEEVTMRLFPKYVVDIAKEAHSDEALLATLAIIIWHFYNVHFNPRKFPMNKVWFTGKLSEEEMLEEHPLEYEEILREEAKS